MFNIIQFLAREDVRADEDRVGRSGRQSANRAAQQNQQLQKKSIHRSFSTRPDRVNNSRQPRSVESMPSAQSRSHQSPVRAIDAAMQQKAIRQFNIQQRIAFARLRFLEISVIESRAPKRTSTDQKILANISTPMLLQKVDRRVVNVNANTTSRTKPGDWSQKHATI